MIYKSYLILISDYLFTLKKNIYFDVVFPFALSLVLGIFLIFNFLNFDKNFIVNATTVLGILAGFNMTAITILTSTNNETVQELKEKKTDIIIDGLEVSFFRKLYILISYSVLICLITIIVNTIGYLISWDKICEIKTLKILKTIDLFLILHIFFVNIRNITSLYFLYFNETNLKGK
ncbi:hypothetical protein BC749_101686 [Flavobacterium araucananum]|uniref:Uncharacterized protein n=1 Tax=Flavobacterium araucananum TaxID=946678 RepID=A0A227PII2_9FLAO|nr:hypothetical protein [Flavobacterium araucananum]OXG09194.1 hypothetical protein B0A64_02385 [Flavobacterium araucananum]PWK02618.1 hypothetical protein BC749_101686 [Flavobacterium araucananum]